MGVRSRQACGLGTDTLSGAVGLYLPLSGGGRVFGVLGVLPSNARRVTLPEQFRLLETFAAQIGLALERADFAAHAQAAEVRAETEAIRNALLASISHDLRTPLATIAGGAATLAGNLDALSSEDRRALANSVSEEAMRMSERITTLLDLVRLETGAIQPRFAAYELAELVGSVLHRLDARLRTRRVRIELPENLPLLQVDGRLIEQYSKICWTTPASTRRQAARSVSALARSGARSRSASRTMVRDCPGTIRKSCSRNSSAVPRRLGWRHRPGARDLPHHRGLHGGRIWAENRAPHGAAFRFSVPRSDEPLLTPDLEDVPVR